MTRIDFYISKEKQNTARQQLACRITEKAYKLGNRVYIHTESSEQTSLIDDLLWKFRDGSFVPHNKSTENTHNPAPIIIGHDKDLAREADVLINLAHEVPGFFSQFERVAELVNDDPGSKTRARERYAFYRDRGYELNTHNL